MVQKRLEKSNCLLNDLKNNGNRILIFSNEKTFTIVPIFSKKADRVVSFWEWCLWAPLSINNQAYSLNHDAWVVERGEDGSGLVWTGLHFNYCRLQRSFGDDGSSMSQEDHQEIKLRLSTGRSTGTHCKNCVELIGRQHELLVQRLWLSQSPDLNPLDFSLLTHIEEEAYNTRHKNTDEGKASVDRACGSMR